MLHLKMIGAGVKILWHQKPARASSREGIKGISQRASVQGKRGTMARGAFGDQVVEHYLNYARTEQGLYDAFVTDWERKRYYERG